MYKIKLNSLLIKILHASIGKNFHCSLLKGSLYKNIQTYPSQSISGNH